MGYTKGRKWTYIDMCNEVRKVMNTLNIKRMPTNSECFLVTKSHALSNYINRSGGFNWLAKHMGLDQSKCETRIGLKGEFKIKKILENLGYKVDKMPLKHPYDLLVNDNIKVDVKTSNKYESNKGWSSYSFNLEKNNPTCDIYIIRCIQDDKTLIIPSKYLKQSQLCITDKESKYDIYKDRWDYFDKYNEFYKKL